MMQDLRFILDIHNVTRLHGVTGIDFSLVTQSRVISYDQLSTF